MDVDGESMSVLFKYLKCMPMRYNLEQIALFGHNPVSYVRDLLDHELLVPLEASVTNPIMVKNLNVRIPYCSDPLGNEFTQMMILN